MPFKTHERAMIACQITKQLNKKDYIRIKIDDWELNINMVSQNFKYDNVKRVIRKTQCLKFFHPSVLKKIGYVVRKR